MALNFNPYQGPRSGDQIPRTIDDIFNSYVAAKNAVPAQALQALQMQNALDARSMQDLQQTAKYGAPASSFSPQERQAAAGSQPLAASGIGPMSPARMDILQKLRDGLLKDAGRDPQTLQAQDLARRKTESEIAENEAQAWALRNPQGKPVPASPGAPGVTAGKMLPPNSVFNLNEGAAVARQLPDVEAALKAAEPIMGPVRGRAGSANPYDTEAQTIDARFRTASQAFGRFMEGGVLRKEDEEKYRKMFPQLSDTPDVARNKLAIVQRMLAQKYESDKGALKGSGYDISGFGSLDIPESLFDQKGPKQSPEAYFSQLLGQGLSEDAAYKNMAQEGY